MAEDRNKQNLVILFLFLLGLGLRLALLSHSGYTADDSFITFKYAENISSGQGFVYNPGEKVMGTTTPLYTLLLALFLKSGLGVISLSKLINILTDCGAGILLFLLLRRLKFSLAFFASLFYILFPRVLVWSISGMETGLYLFIISLSFYFYSRKDFKLVPIFLALAFLTRFDGLILSPALFLDYLIKYKKLPWRMIAFTFLLILPWLIFATFYFNSPIPHSILAKKALYQGVLQTPGETILWEFLILKSKIGWLILVLSVLGIQRILRKMRDLSFIVIWTFLYMCFYYFAGTRMHIWYYVPFYLGYLTLTAQGLVFLYENFGAFREKVFKGGMRFASLREIKVAFLVVIISFSIFIYWRQLERTFKLVKNEQIVLEQIHKQIALWLRENSDYGDTVSAGDIGYIGYFSQRYILDQAGLISPQAIPFNRKQNRLELVQKYKPRYFVLGLQGPYYEKVLNSDWFKNNYKLSKRFNILTLKNSELGINFSQHDFATAPEYAIYKRAETLD
ncbi:MAG: hypothetical protein WBD28_10125 [Candidatus Zixiibacteriota bacterium]